MPSPSSDVDMTATQNTSDRAAVRDTPLLATAAAAGLLLGFTDLSLQLSIGYPIANLANSSAVWALSAFMFAFCAHTTPTRAALAGAVLLIAATEAYYATAVLIGRADVATLWSANTMRWVQFGVLAGVIFGVAGTWLHDGERGGRPWRAAAGLAVASAVFLAEAGVRLLPESGSALDDLGTIMLMITAAGGVLLSSISHPRRLLRASVLVPPLAVVGTLVFALAGF